MTQVISIPVPEDRAHDYKGFWQDFAIADRFGIKAVKDTYKRAKAEWKGNVQYFASLVMTLNHRLWMHYENGRMDLAKVYDALWKDADAYGCKHFKGKDAEYYFNFLD